MDTKTSIKIIKLLWKLEYSSKFSKRGFGNICHMMEMSGKQLWVFICTSKNIRLGVYSVYPRLEVRKVKWNIT